MRKVTESIRVEDRIKTELVKIGGEFQQKIGESFTYSDTIDMLIKSYRQHQKEVV